jgi:hypothetical protein
MGARTFTQTGDLGQEFLKDKQANGSTQGHNPMASMTLERQEAALAVNLGEQGGQSGLALECDQLQLFPEIMLKRDGGGLVQPVKPDGALEGGLQSFRRKHHNTPWHLANHSRPMPK